MVHLFVLGPVDQYDTLHVNTTREKPAILEASPNKRSIGPLGFAGSVEREVVEVPGAIWGGEIKGLERRGLREERLERGLAAPHRRTSTIPRLFSAKVTLQQHSLIHRPNSSFSFNQTHRISTMTDSLLVCKSVCRLMRGAWISRWQPSRFLTSCRIPHRTLCRTSGARGGSCGGVGGVGDRFQSSLLRDCGQLLPQKLPTSPFFRPCFLVPLLVQIPSKVSGYVTTTSLCH